MCQYWLARKLWPDTVQKGGKEGVQRRGQGQWAPREEPRHIRQSALRPDLDLLRPVVSPGMKDHEMRPIWHWFLDCRPQGQPPEEAEPLFTNTESHFHENRVRSCRTPGQSVYITKNMHCHVTNRKKRESSKTLWFCSWAFKSRSASVTSALRMMGFMSQN